MANTYDKASLVLIPSGTKEGKIFSQKPTNGDGDFTFSRASAATRVNADGLIEKETQNLILQSNQFDTTWTTVNATLTSGQSGYDGTNDAWRLGASPTSSAYIVQGSFSTLRTQSIYAKAGTYDQVSILVGGYVQGVQFDLSNGTIVINSNSSLYYPTITPVGAGWYRISVFVAPSAPTYGFLIAPQILAGGGIQVGEYIYIQDAQLEQGLVARDYIETTTTAVYGGITDNIPRLDYNGSCPSLLLEPQRTNNIPYSEYNSSGIVLGSNLTFNGYVQSPEGVNNGARFTSITPSASYLQISNVTIPSGTFTFSMWVRGVSGTFVNRNMYIPSHTGTQATMNEAPVAGEDWKLVYGSGTNTSGSSYVRTITLPFYDQPASSVFEVYGFQLEEGSYVTSYIPTYGTSVTRVNDSCVKTGVSDLIGQTEGTLFLDFVYNGKSNTTSDNFNLTLGTWSSNVIAIGNYNATLYARIYASSVLNFNQDFGTMTTGTRYKCAIAYASNDAVFYVNGSLVGSDASVVVPNTSTISLNRSSYENSKDIGQVLLFKTRLSNEELAALTQV